MRAGKTIGGALAVMVGAALATLWQAPAVAAAGQQAASQNQQAETPKVEKRTVTVYKQNSGGEPVTVTVQAEPGQAPKVMMRGMQAEPMFAAIADGPRLGVEIRDLGKEDLAKFKLTSQNGVAVEQVTKESAAEKAGVKAGDVVVQYDGENVRSAAQLTRLVRESVAGRTVKLGIVRDGKRMDLDVAPAEAENVFNMAVAPGRPERGQMFSYRTPAPGEMPPPGGTFEWRQGTPAPMPRPDIETFRWFGSGDAPGNLVYLQSRGRLGVNVQELTPELAAYFGVKDGLLVNSVQDETPAAKAGIKAGDVIGSVNGKAVVTPAELVKELADKEGEVTIGITRDKKALSLKAALEPRKTPARRTIVVGRPA
jgi:serine protease Do